MQNTNLCDSAWQREEMDNDHKAQNLLNVFTSDKVEKCVLGENGENLDLFSQYVLRLSEEDANAIYV